MLIQDRGSVFTLSGPKSVLSNSNAYMVHVNFIPIGNEHAALAVLINHMGKMLPSGNLLTIISFMSQRLLISFSWCIYLIKICKTYQFHYVILPESDMNHVFQG